jgi:hypothetical protein
MVALDALEHVTLQYLRRCSHIKSPSTSALAILVIRPSRLGLNNRAADRAPPATT